MVKRASMIVGCAVAVLAAAVGPAHGGPLTETGCDDLTAANADYEAYGPTDVNAQTGDGHVTVGENAQGTLTVFKWPNPSFYNQVKYVAVARDAAGRPQAQFPNEGVFAGLRYVTPAGTGFTWLRDWPSRQRYDSTDTAVPVTRWRSPAALGIVVSAYDVAAGDAFERQFVVRRAHGSPVRTATLVLFENLNPIATRLPYLPIADWCLSQLSDQQARYDTPAHAVVHAWQGVDAASGKATSVALAAGWDGADSEHQVGADGQDPAALPGGPADGYGQAAARLGGSASATGQTTGALAQPLDFDGRGRAGARFTIAAGTDEAAALAALRTARAAPFAATLARSTADWRGWLSRTTLPKDANRRVIAVAKRSLISVRLAIVPGSGAIVASADTQGPYGEDWIRDGAFINEVLDRNGYTTAVTEHNRFYARVQTSPANPSPLRPPGNWTMASYGDGIDGAPIPWEIDETGLGIWTLARHATYLDGAQRAAYLRDVYPAITRAADFLTTCADPTNGLQCPASEDDNPTPSQSLHGAETTVLGLQSALDAAALLRDSGAAPVRWRARLTTLLAAVEHLYDPRRHAYGEGNTAGNAYDADFQDGGWLLWPVQLKAYDDPSMVGEAADVQASLDRSLAQPNGEYQARGLLGLAHAWAVHPTDAQSRELHGVLTYLATTLTTPTGLFGEAWKRFSGGRPQPVEDMPHVWEHSLFYLAALEIDGGRRYRFQGPGHYARACRARLAPPALC